MENQLIWKDEYNIGVDNIDREHQKLFGIINELFALRDEEKIDPEKYKDGIRYLKEHALQHFLDEEVYMEFIEHKELEMHKRLHKGFREETLPALEQELIAQDYSLDAVDHFLGVCAGWLIGHTLTEDRAIAGDEISKWVDLLPDEELAEIKKVIVKLLDDMFQLEAQIVSDTYGGERFGKGVYYRLVYGTDGGDKKWEVILVFEEKIIIQTVGRIMGIRSDKLDIVLVNATRYTARQFVWRIMQHFPSLQQFELKEENLLSYDQFQEVIGEKNPQISLLFNTPGGYFAYCVIAPHLLQEGIGTPIGADNAMEEIGRYLQTREEVPKKKILVVDDSITMRQMMRRLLGEDYEVSVVKSGLSAIRAITLDRPDLVLLDYEMPVCDGRHVLEMLRSEEEFADVPVIFLTSLDDPESVKKVLALRSEGYLLKFLKPAEIKQRIRDYFQMKEKCAKTR